MKRMKYTLLLVVLLTPCAANAAFPEGQWAVDNVVDIVTLSTIPSPSLYMGFGFCIQADGRWYGTTAPNPIKGSGRWAMKGKDIHLHMNRYESYGVFSESIELKVVNSKYLNGYWQQWNLTNTQDDYMTTKWIFKSKTCLAKV